MISYLIKKFIVVLIATLIMDTILYQIYEHGFIITLIVAWVNCYIYSHFNPYVFEKDEE